MHTLNLKFGNVSREKANRNYVRVRPRTLPYSYGMLCFLAALWKD